jgi:hypothetical protein
MLHEFITSNRAELIARCREKAAERFSPAATPAAVDCGVPLFLEQLADILRPAQLTIKRDRAEPATTPAGTDISRAATAHGAEMLRLGFTIDQVVREYGDVCQSVTDMAIEQTAPISANEFRTLNRCLDDAIADAVTSFGAARQNSLKDRVESLQDRLDFFSVEHRRLVNTAMKAYSAIRTGDIGVRGSTGNLLRHALEELHELGDRALPELRLAITAEPDTSAAGQINLSRRMLASARK